MDPSPASRSARVVEGEDSLAAPAALAALHPSLTQAGSAKAAGQTGHVDEPYSADDASNNSMFNMLAKMKSSHASAEPASPASAGAGPKSAAAKRSAEHTVNADDHGGELV